MTVTGQANLLTRASPSQVTIYQTSPALFGLLSTVQGTATLQYAPGGSPNSASLVDGQGNVQGTLQGGQITLTSPAALTFNPPGSIPAPVAPATPANAGTPSASSLAGVAVRLGNTAAMTGLDAAGAIPATPGFTLAPPMAPLPGYSPPNLNLPPLTGTPIPDQPAMPISTGTPLPNVNLGNWQETFPISDPLPTILMVTPTGTTTGTSTSTAASPGYYQNADGTVTGPNGGSYAPTGKSDAAGNEIYVGGNGNYYTLQVVGIVADVLSFVPVVDAIAIPVAIAVGAAEGAQDLADGNILGGVLALAGSAAGGVGQYASDIGEAIGESTADVTTAAQDVSRGVAAAQGVDGAVTGAEDGDPLAALTSLAGGVAGSAGAGTDWGKGLAAGSALTGAGVAAAGGNWMSALAATQTAAAGAGLFGTYDPDDNAAPAASDSQDPPPGWQSAAVQPVQQEDLPPLDAAAAASAGMATPATIAAASTTASTQATVATTVSQATNTSPVDPDAPDGPNGSSQQQADAQQAAQQQAAQRLGATMAAQANAASLPATAQATLNAQANGSSTSQSAAPSSDTPAGTIDLGTVTVYANAPPIAADTVMAGAGAATPEAFLPEIGDAALTGLTYLGRGLLTLGEGVVGGVVLPAAALVGGVLWPSSLGSDDTLTGQAGTGGVTAAQSNPPDSNTPPPPPPAVSPSGQTGSPTGPENPDGNSTVQGSQPATTAPTSGSPTPPRTFTSTDPLVGDLATKIEAAVPGSVNGVNVSIADVEAGLSSEADISLSNGDIIEVKSGGGKGATTQVANQQQILGDGGEVIVYGPDLKGSVMRGIVNNGTKVFTNLDDLTTYLKSKLN